MDILHLGHLQMTFRGSFFPSKEVRIYQTNLDQSESSPGA
jgi:hypothetical protein